MIVRPKRLSTRLRAAFSQAGQLDLVTRVVASRLYHNSSTNKFEQLTLQALQNAPEGLPSRSEFFHLYRSRTDPARFKDQLFRAPSCNAHQHTTSRSWPKRTGPARPTDQWSGQLPEEEIRRLFGANDEVPLELHENGYNINGEVTNFEWQWPRGTFGEEITSELFRNGD